jgi:hypothetical protein
MELGNEDGGIVVDDMVSNGHVWDNLQGYTLTNWKNYLCLRTKCSEDGKIVREARAVRMLLSSDGTAAPGSQVSGLRIAVIFPQ